MLGLDHSEGGEALFDGKPYSHLKQPARIVGAMIDAKAFHKARSAKNHLKVIAAASGIDFKRVDEVLELTGLTEVANKKVGSFSLGMAQRVGIAAALLGEPKYLILDEPVNGLDPEGVIWVRELCKSYSKKGNSVLISSHLMSELEQTIDEAVIIGQGKIITSGSIEQIKAKTSNKQIVRINSLNKEQLVTTLRNRNIVYKEDGDDLLVEDISPEVIGMLALEEKIVLSKVEEVELSLEDAFLELTNTSVEFHAKSNLDTKDSDIKEGQIND
jgi:ABC-2 type transport system ATP-binding protein